MRRALVFAILLLSACGRPRPIADEEVAVRVSGPPSEIEAGRSFPLEVVRSWSKELEPDPWSDGALAPLVLRLDGTERREDSRHVEEIRRFRAYAFEPGTAVVPAVAFGAAPKTGGPARSATADGFTVKVKATLDPKNPGPPEPPELMGEPLRWQLWATVGLAALVAGAFLVRTSLRRSRSHETTAPLSGRERALARLGQLGGTAPRTREEDLAWHVEAAALLRDWLAEDRTLPAHESSTEELIAAPRTAEVLAPRTRAALAAVLSPADLVKFARHGSSPAEREKLLAAAKVVLEEPRT